MAIGSPLVGAMTGTAAATTSAVPYPSGITAGMLLVLFQTTGSATVLTTNPTGWTQVASFSNTGNTLAPTLYLGIKVADGTESGTLTVTHGNVAASSQILAFPGVDTSTPQDVAATTVDTSTASTNAVIPSLTTTRAGVCLVYGAALNAATNTATPPSSPGTFVEDGDAGATRSGTTGHLVWSGSGATGTVTVVWSGTIKGCAAMLALRPAVTDVDTASAVDGQSLASALSSADAGSAVEAAAVAVTLTVSDGGTAVEGSLTAVARSATDSASGVDAAAVGAAVVGADTAAVVDVGLVTVSVADADVAVGSDVLFTRTVTTAEMATAAEAAALGVLLAGADIGAAADTARVLTPSIPGRGYADSRPRSTVDHAPTSRVEVHVR